MEMNFVISLNLLSSRFSAALPDCDTRASAMAVTTRRRAAAADREQRQKQRYDKKFPQFHYVTSLEW
jgi:hypothetical protein